MEKTPRRRWGRKGRAGGWGGEVIGERTAGGGRESDRRLVIG